jgi:hypothetical protein
MVKKWIGARSMTNAAIHLPFREHGLGIGDMEDINDERKLTVLCQFLHSNDNRLRESTMTNIRTELGQRRIILASGYNVLSAPKASTREIARKHTLLYNMEEIIKKYGLKLMIKKSKECWCAFPEGFNSKTYKCWRCEKNRHEYCDPRVKREGKCFVCSKRVVVRNEERNHPLKWKEYQDNRYN